MVHKIVAARTDAGEGELSTESGAHGAEEGLVGPATWTKATRVSAAKHPSRAALHDEQRRQRGLENGWLRQNT